MMTAEEYEEKGLMYLEIAHMVRKREKCYGQRETVCLSREEYDKLLKIKARLEDLENAQDSLI